MRSSISTRTDSSLHRYRNRFWRSQVACYLLVFFGFGPSLNQLGAEELMKSGLADELVVRWQYEAKEAIESSPAVAEGKVFVADAMGRVYAIDAATGNEVWVRNFDTGFISSPAISPGPVSAESGSEKASGNSQVLVIGDFEGNLYCLSLADGSTIWQKTTDGEINGDASFYKENVLVTSQDGKLYCFAVSDGSLEWSYQTDDQIRCSPAIAGNLTFLGGCDGQLHMVDLDTGEAAGKPLPLQGPTGSTPAIGGDRAFLPIMDGVVFAFDWRQQKRIWMYEDAEFQQEYRSSAAVGHGIVIVSSARKQVDALSAETGERLWRYTLRRRAEASPLIVGNDVFMAGTDGRLVRLNLKDGSEHSWSFEIRGSFLSAPIVDNERLFIADEDGIVRCFAASDS